MSDEFYVCNGCGAFDCGSYKLYRLKNNPDNEDNTKIEKLIDCKIYAGDLVEEEDLKELDLNGLEHLEWEEIEFCSECKQEVTFSCVCSTEDR